MKGKNRPSRRQGKKQQNIIEARCVAHASQPSACCSALLGFRHRDGRCWAACCRKPELRKRLEAEQKAGVQSKAYAPNAQKVRCRP